MSDLREHELKRPSQPRRTTASFEEPVEERLNFANDDVPPRAARAEGYGRYDLSWDGVSGGCGTDEGY